MIKLTIQSIRHTIFWAVVCGIAYPFAMTLVAKVCFRDQAEGSLIVRDGKIVGSALMAQQFTGTNYFWPRPSSCSYGTGGTGIAGSSGSNQGPTSGTLQTNVMNNLASMRSAHNLDTNAPVPADLVYASASGLDPHISPEAAQFQVKRVAAARGMKEDDVKALVDRFTEPPQWGIFGEPRVNVLLLNIALDGADAASKAGVKKAEVRIPSGS